MINNCNGCRFFARRHYGDTNKGFCEKHLFPIEDCTKQGCTHKERLV